MFKRLAISLILPGLLLVANTVGAEDLFATAMQGNIQDSLGGSSMFWKIFMLVDIILATAVAISTKNPMAFLGVAAIAFIPAFLIKTFVFP